jgi:hypothetical protein
MRVRTSTCQTWRVDDEQKPSALWVALDRRRREPRINLGPRALANDRTMAKIKRGEVLDTRRAGSREVYENLDRLLQWRPGSAEACARYETPPEPLEFLPEMRRTRYLEGATVFSRLSASLLTADSPDDVDPELLAEAERQARQLLDEELKRRNQPGGTGSRGGQRTT